MVKKMRYGNHIDKEFLNKEEKRKRKNLPSPKGIGPALILVIIIATAILLFGGNAIISQRSGSGTDTLGTIFAGNDNTSQEARPQNLSDVPGPVEIGSKAASHFPFQAFWDYFAGGTTAVVHYISDYIFLPFANFFGSVAAGRPIIFPSIIGLLMFILLATLVIWRKRDAIYQFLTRNLVVIFIALAAIFILVVFFATR